MKYIFLKFIYFYIPNFTKFKPIPSPAPWRIDGPATGINVSKILKLAAATKAMINISSSFNAFCGTIAAATETANPSTKYLITRLIISLMLRYII